MFRLGNSLWVLVCNLILSLFGFLINRFPGGDDESYKNEDDKIVCKNHENLKADGSSESEDLGFSFGFQFQTSKDSTGCFPEAGNSVAAESGSTTSTSRYQFVSGKDESGFMEEPKTMSFVVQEMFMGSFEGSNDHEKVDDFAKISGIEAVLEGEEHSTLGDHELSKNEEMDVSGENLSAKESAIDGDQYLSEDGFSPCDSKREDDPGEGFIISTHKVDSENNDSSSDTDTEGHELETRKQDDESHVFETVKRLWPEQPLLEEQHVFLAETSSQWQEPRELSQPFRLDNHGTESNTCMPIDDNKVEIIENNQSPEEISSKDMSFWNSENFLGRESEDSDDEYIELEPHLQDSTELGQQTLSSVNFAKVDDGLGQSEEHSSGNKPWIPECDEEDEKDILWEHRELVEQMKMEMKSARIGGLPTISEECESPKVVEDLKPLKIDEKIEHRDRMQEIQKFYRSYAERMRKLDVLNYQTMHAISFLQLKDPNQLISRKDSSVWEMKSLLVPNLWQSKLRRIYVDPTLNSIKELHRDLEAVYVGQVCASWEILRWQYGKVKELLEYDPQGLNSYNQVAGEFQQFHVLLRRFIEDEPFQGPRIQHYVNLRRALRTLLQVPTVKDDCLKDKKGRREEEENLVTITMLAEIMEETMQVFREFLCADKGFQGLQVNLQSNADTELLMDIKSCLEKKEKRLKDILRSGNCIVKKFQRPHSGRLNHALFLSQVELRLVSRVLSQSRLTKDQLIWCQTKLDNINFVNRRIHVEPSFLLFPC
ncbi:hypothetical protein RJ639_040401 [Escallonia herrerae]|uniref:Ribosomal protein L34Ae n=1 Tax=Escallonia herrerae TaxID=1293975 RepID=A0AA88WID7_9ASTE|nr:hypothetical protein RJ639_040401 [Escallonia herrerae]